MLMLTLISIFCSRSEQLSDGVASTPLNVARERLEIWRASAWKMAR